MTVRWLPCCKSFRQPTWTKKSWFWSTTSITYVSRALCDNQAQASSVSSIVFLALYSDCYQESNKRQFVGVKKLEKLFSESGKVILTFWKTPFVNLKVSSWVKLVKLRIWRLSIGDITQINQFNQLGVLKLATNHAHGSVLTPPIPHKNVKSIAIDITMTGYIYWFSDNYKVIRHFTVMDWGENLAHLQECWKNMTIEFGDKYAPTSSRRLLCHKLVSETIRRGRRFFEKWVEHWVDSTSSYSIYRGFL